MSRLLYTAVAVRGWSWIYFKFTVVVKFGTIPLKLLKPRFLSITPRHISVNQNEPYPVRLLIRWEENVWSTGMPGRGPEHLQEL